MTVPIRIPVSFALFSALVLLPVGCGGSAGSPQAAEGGLKKRELPSVRVAPVTVREMAQVLETTSKLESEREIQLMPRVAGVVLGLEAEEGDEVGEGEVLAILDDVEQNLAVKDAGVALKEAQNALDRLRLAEREADARVSRMLFAFEQAKRDYERNLQLFEGVTASALSESALEASRLAKDNCDADCTDAGLNLERVRLEIAAGETAVQRAQINLERAEVTLGYTKITAPFDGVIAQRGVRVGDAAGPSTTAFVLSDVSLLRCVFSRPQEELAIFSRVGNGNGEGRLELTATADSYPGRVFQGWIERVSPTIDPESTQFRVTGRLECVQEGGRVRLLPGMLVRLRIVTELHEKALVVPKRALEREGDRRYLLAVAEGAVRRVEVREGFAEDEWIEVLPVEESSLAEGDSIVVVGGRDLNDGDEVRVDGTRDSDRTQEAPPAEMAEETTQATDAAPEDG